MSEAQTLNLSVTLFNEVNKGIWLDLYTLYDKININYFTKIVSLVNLCNN